MDMLLLVVMVGSLALVVHGFRNIWSEWSQPVVMIFGIVFVLSVLYSFLHEEPIGTYPIEIAKIHDTGVKIILIEKGMDGKVREFTELKDRGMLTAKNFYVTKFKNAWGIEMTQHEKVKYEQ